MTPLDIFFDDDFTGWGAVVPPPPPVDTMEVTQDIGPTAAQMNIPAAGANVNNISITATKAGHTLLIAKAVFEGLTVDSLVRMYIQRNGVYIPASQANLSISSAVALDYATLIAAAAITDAIIGEIFTIRVHDSTSTADLPIDQSSLITVTA